MVEQPGAASGEGGVETPRVGGGALVDECGAADGVRRQRCGEVVGDVPGECGGGLAQRRRDGLFRAGFHLHEVGDAGERAESFHHLSRIGDGGRALQGVNAGFHPGDGALQVSLLSPQLLETLLSGLRFLICAVRCLGKRLALIPQRLLLRRNLRRLSLHAGQRLCGLLQLLR